jgi:hypothetical protein
VAVVETHHIEPGGQTTFGPTAEAAEKVNHKRLHARLRLIGHSRLCSDASGLR